MKIISLIILIFSLNASANFMSPSDYAACGSGEVTTYLNAEVCKEVEKEECMALPQGINCTDFDVVDTEEGKKLVHNESKKVAREAAIKAQEEAEKTKQDKKKNFSFKGTTILQLRQEMNEWLQLQKEQ